MSRISGSSLAATLALAVVIFAAPSLRAQQQSHVEEQALFRLENEWTQAVVHRDAGIMRRLTAPRWVYSDESGIMERDAGIKAFTTGTDTVREASNEKMRALIYDNAAVVVGILVMKGRGPHGAFTNRYRYTDSWVKMDGRWQCIASQDYLMPSPRR
ncbi:MAG: nuclear transport factor 2 family protein [bacterium]